MGSAYVAFGKAVGTYISDDVIAPEGLIDILKIRPIVRMGHFDYLRVNSV